MSNLLLCVIGMVAFINFIVIILNLDDIQKKIDEIMEKLNDN